MTSCVTIGALCAKHWIAGASAVTWNPSDHGAHESLSNGNLTATGTFNGADGLARATAGASTGKKYFEWTTTSTGGYFGFTHPVVGLVVLSVTGNIHPGMAVGSGFGWAGGASDTLNVGWEGTKITSSTFTNSDQCAIAWDADAGKVWIRKNGTWVTGNPANGTSPIVTGVTGTLYPAVNGGVVTARFSGPSFVHAAPLGFGVF